MKKLLSVIGAMTLIGTVSTSVVACDGGEEPSSSPKEKIDLDSFPKNVTLINIAIKDVNDFTTMFKQELSKTTNYEAITTDNNVVIKKNDNSSLEPEDIKTSSLTIKIIASQSTNFSGEKVISINLTVNKKDLSTITKLTGLNIVADSTKVNNDLWDKILEANELKNYRVSIKADWFNKIYATNNSSDTDSIKGEYQKPGSIYVVIQATNTWSDSLVAVSDTQRLQVILH